MVAGLLEIREPDVLPTLAARCDFTSQTFACLGRSQRCLEAVGAAVVRPIREHDQKPRAAVHVRVAVERDVEPSVASLFDQTQHVACAARRRETLIEMGDVRWTPGPPPDFDRLLEGVKEAIAE